MKPRLPKIFAIAVVIAAVPHAAISAAEPETPNIILVLTDDQGYADAGFRDPQVHTPNLDRLVASGVELKRFYTAPVCSPTRAWKPFPNWEPVK